MTITLAQGATAAATGSVAGLMIGAIGVGGIIVVPVLIEAGIDVQRAIACAMASYIAAGLVGAAMYFQQGHLILDGHGAPPLLLAAIPAAFGASFIVQYIGDVALKATLYALMVTSSAFALAKTLRDRRASRETEVAERPVCATEQAVPGDSTGASAPALISEQPRECPALEEPSSDDPKEAPHSVEGPQHSRVVLAGVGALTGFCSALTGTSGPVVGLPVLVMIKMPIRASLGCVQAVQVPIAIASTVAYLTLRPDTLDLILVMCLSTSLAPGVAIGACIASRLPAAELKLLVVSVLVLSSIVLLVKLVIGEVL